MTILLLFSEGLCDASAKSQDPFLHKSRFFLSRNGPATELQIRSSLAGQVEGMLASLCLQRQAGLRSREKTT